MIWTTEGGTRERLVLIAFHRPGARGGAEVRRRKTPSTVTVERWCRDARRPRRSSLMILFCSRVPTGDRRDATGGRGLSVRQKDVRRTHEVVAGETR